MFLYPPPQEVAKHRDLSSGIWVTYKGEVYNITEFVEAHPGGSQKIMLAAGGSIGGEILLDTYQSTNLRRVMGHEENNVP